MELVQIPIFFSFLLFVFTLLRIRKNKSQTQNSNPPPGPWKFPIIGNIPQLAGALPHHRFRDLAKKYGPVMSIQLGQVPSVVVSSAETAKEVLKTHDVQFAGRPIVLAAQIVFYNRMDIVFGEYGDHWRQMRKICTLELLSAKRVQSFRPVRQQEVADFIDFLRSKAGISVNLTKTIFALTNSIMAVTAIGKKYGDQEALLSIIDGGVEGGAGYSIADVFPSFKFLHYITGEYSKLIRLHKKTDKVLEEIISESKERRRSGDRRGEIENLLDVLLDLQESGNLQVPLTNASIKGAILEMFGAGSDTSSKTTEWAMAELMRHPKEMKKVQEEVRRVFGKTGKVEESRLDELDYLKLVVKETLRLHPPGALIPRECSETRRIGGYDIHPKTKVIVSVWAINRDPSIWTEPEKFWPERFKDNPINYHGSYFEYIPFGAGKRICPGITLGVINLELFLANLLYHFDWKFPDGITAETLDMTDGLGGVFRRKVDLELIPIPHFL
ncbi:cytochrome P450 family 71 subfamily B polypeptide 4 [Euphorbia peplus]|nr:putative cytochrome P450 monooxygenase [Euphorbia peplus]WCJ37114.1 cytochrome P450 family 71 subfamily B polypeptide 4 [Euphorbia peplus]